jgi:hypothetical protein
MTMGFLEYGAPAYEAIYAPLIGAVLLVVFVLLALGVARTVRHHP